MRRPWRFFHARAWWVPLVLLVLLALINRYTDWYMAEGWGRQGLTLGCALLAVWAWGHLALAPPPAQRLTRRLRCWAFVLGAWWAGAWTLVWLLLPAWGLLKVVSLGLFAPVSAWRWWCAGRRLLAAGAGVGWVFGLLVIAVTMLANPWRRERLLDGVWPVGDPDLYGKHYAWGRLMEALAALSPTGGGWSAVPPVLTRVDDAAWLLRVGTGFGWVPMGLLAAALVLGWLLLTAWLARSPVGDRLSLRRRRLGVALGLFHALAAGLYVAWSLGYLFIPMGALAPLAHAGWGVLTLALTALGVRAWQQRRLSAVRGGADNRAAAPEPFFARRSVWAKSGLAWLALAAVGVGCFPAHVKGWQTEKAERAQQYRTDPRLELADRTGEHLLTRNVLAHDLWIRPADFWGASWANPKEGVAHFIESAPTRLTDAQREAALLDALAPWPLAARIAGERLAGMNRSAIGPVRLLWAQPQEVVDAVRARLLAAGIEGVEFQPRWARTYPQGALTAHAVGFASLSTEGYGQEGLEMVLDRRLRAALAGRQPRGPLRTSLDLDVQRLASSALQAAMENHRASTGSVMVVDAATSEVLALASAPTFDPNDATSHRYPYRPDRVLNQATARPVALGSLLTPLLVADLLQRGEVQPDTVVAMEGAQGVQIGKLRVRDAHPAERATLTEIVEKSSNMGQAKLALRMTEAQLQALLRGSGLHGASQMTGILGADFLKPDWSAWTLEQQATAGQNLSSTLARAVQAYVPIANGGMDRRLSLLPADELRRAHATSYVSTERRVLSEQTACKVRRMLHHATGATGTAPLAQVTGVSVAGKTATATHLPVMEEGGAMRYLPQADALFIGMAPAELPRYVIGVQLGFADGKPRWGGQVAAPVFAQVVRGLYPTGLAPTDADPACAMPAPDDDDAEIIR